MKKNIHLYLLLILSVMSSNGIWAQVVNKEQAPAPARVGYYQKIDFSPDTPCGCDKKTDRTRALNKALATRDVEDYYLHAYRFTFLETPAPVAKLFKALEGDASVYKVSMKEWDSFMLLTTADFDNASFEAAAKIAFATFEPMQPEDFLKSKNLTAYDEYMQVLQKMKQYTNLQQNTNH